MAPDFRSTTQDGMPLTLADLRGQRTILYFYPKDNTSGCTLEAQSLRDGREEPVSYTHLTLPTILRV